MRRIVECCVLLAFAAAMTPGVVFADGGAVCAGAPVINLPADMPYNDLGTTCGKTDNYPTTVCASSYDGGEDAVYEVNVTVAGTYSFALSGTDTYTGFFVTDGCPDVALTCTGFSTSSTGNPSGNITFPSAGTYFLQIDTWPSPACTAYTLDISAPAAPPTNDEPAGAIALAVGQDFAAQAIVATNLSATASEVADPTIPSPGCASYTGGDVWFTAQVTANGSLTLETDTNSDGISDMGIAVYSGAIGALALVECDDDDGNGLFSQVAVTGRTPGEMLYLRAWEFGNNVFGTFQVSAWDSTVPVELQSFSIE